MKPTKHFDIFLGVKTSDMEVARAVCARFIGQPLQCTNSMFFGGDHCHTTFGGGEFSLRLNHHDDGFGWSWCLKDQRYPLVLGLYFPNPLDALPFMDRVKDFDLLVDTRSGVAR
jgi:hypothetical protein